MKVLAGFGLIVLGMAVVEIQLFAIVTDAVGAVGTVLLIVATGACGVAALRRLGRAAFQQLRAGMSGIPQPPPDLLQSGFVVIGGLLLISPGFFSDFIGALFLLPAARRWLIRHLLPRLTRWQWHVQMRRRARWARGAGAPDDADSAPPPPPEPPLPRRPDGSKPDIIEGKYRRRD